MKAIAKTGYAELQDAPFFRYGVSFRVPLVDSVARGSAEMKYWLEENLPRGASAHIVLGESSLMIHLNFGSYTKATTADKAIEDIRSKTGFIKDSMQAARKHTASEEDFVWFPEWDWDELDMY